MNSSDYKRILFITQWEWEDALVQTNTLPYVRIIGKMTGCYCYVVTTGKSISTIKISKIQDIISIQIPSGKKKSLYLNLLKSILVLRIITIRKKISCVHCWCTVAGAIGAILKQGNKNCKLVIDSFEPHAEAMAENKTWKRRGLKYNLLFYFEKLETRIADRLIFAAPGMENYIFEKYKTRVSDYFVKPACIDLKAFSFNRVKNKELLNKYGLEDKIVCVYAGKFGGIYLEDEVFQFIKACENYWGTEKFRFLLLSNVSDDYLLFKLSSFKLQLSTSIKLFVPHNEIPQYIGLADFALCPVKPVPSKKYCTPIKDGEYWAMGLPVVITKNISVDSDIIKENNAGAVLEGLDEKSYQDAINSIDAIIKDKTRAETYAHIRPLAEKYRNFGIAVHVYEQIYVQK